MPSAEREGNQVVLRVRDDGIGIAPEVLPRLFNLFMRGDRPLGRTQGGLGIGLTLVAQARGDAGRDRGRPQRRARPRQRVHRPPARLDHPVAADGPRRTRGPARRDDPGGR